MAVPEEWKIDRPNIVLITCDQLRGDCIGADGHPVVETPNIDTLAAGGVRFSRAYTAVPSCIAARAAIFTGLTPRSHGRVGYEDCVPWDYDITLPGELARAGYQTQGVGKMHVYPCRSLLGFHAVTLHDGFLHAERDRRKRIELTDDYLPWLRERAGREADYIDTGLECNSWVARPWHLDESLHPTNWVVTKAAEFLNRRDPRKPFFLWMSFVRPHSPLDPPQAYWDMYREAEIPPRIVGDWAKRFPEGAIVPASGFEGRLDERAYRRARRAYYALVTHIDHQIGRFMQHLVEHDEANNTIIIFASDHGDLLGDHNLLRKGLPYEGCVRVPLVMHAPAGTDVGFRRGAVVDAPVELRDIMPTCLEAAGAAIGESVEGASLLPLARAEKADWRDYVHGEHTHAGGSVHYLTDGREKYVWFSETGAEQLFDLEGDPDELHDLAGDCDHKPRLLKWRAALIEELRGREEGFTDGETLISGRPVRPTLSHIRRR